MSTPAEGLWSALAARVAETHTERDGPGRGAELAGMVDPAEFRPQLAPDVEVKQFRLRWGND